MTLLLVEAVLSPLTTFVDIIQHPKTPVHPSPFNLKPITRAVFD